MIDESRFQRLEDKVDTVKDNVNDLSKELIEQRKDLKRHMDVVESHVTGDNKIITELQPILNKLPDIVKMAEEYHEEKIVQKKLTTYSKMTFKIAGGVGAIVGVLTGILKLITL